MSKFNLMPETLGMLSGRIDYLANRHDLITQNIANIDTHDYKSKEAEFMGFLQDSLGEGDVTQKSVMGYKPNIRVKESHAPTNEYGNNVEFEKETTKLADNSIQFMAAADVAKKYLSLMRMAVSDK